MKFKPGDLVICIDNVKCHSYFNIGSTYKVENVTPFGDLIFSHISGSWDHARFRLDGDHGQSAKKNDTGKPRFDILVSMFGLDTVCVVLGEGAIEYGDFNWRKSKDDPKYRMRLIAACMRHVYQYATGTKIDAKSGKPHLAHAICNLLMVLDMETE